MGLFLRKPKWGQGHRNLMHILYVTYIICVLYKHSIFDKTGRTLPEKVISSQHCAWAEVVTSYLPHPGSLEPLPSLLLANWMVKALTHSHIPDSWFPLV